jgi:hypothetical protein
MPVFSSGNFIFSETLGFIPIFAAQKFRTMKVFIAGILVRTR